MFRRHASRDRWSAMHLAGARNPPLAVQRVRVRREPSDPSPLRRLMLWVFQ